MSDLRKKSLHELRMIAQSFGIADIFKKDVVQLAQAIEMRQDTLYKPKIELPERPSYDARLMSKSPSRKTSAREVDDALRLYKQFGLSYSFDDERWYMTCQGRTDEGTLRMPLRNVILCAEKLIKSGTRI